MKTNRGKTVALWLLGLALLGVSFFFDDAVLAWMSIHRTPALYAFGQFGSHYGQWNWLMVPCLLVAVAAWYLRKEDWLRVLCIMVISSILGGMGANAVRATTGRTRPSAVEIQQGWYGPRANGTWVVINSKYNAFPSAHAAASMALIAPLILLRRRIGWVLMPVALLIACARICVNAHHLSDVIGGALLGFAIASLVVWKLGPIVMRWRIFKEPMPSN